MLVHCMHKPWQASPGFRDTASWHEAQACGWQVVKLESGLQDTKKQLSQRQNALQQTEQTLQQATAPRLSRFPMSCMVP